MFCAQLSPVQLRLSAPSDGWWRCDRGQIALALAAAASYHKHHTSTLASNSFELRHYLGWIMGCIIPCKMKSQFSWATLTLDCKSMTCQTCGANQDWDGHKKNCQLLFIQDYILCSHNNVDMEDWVYQVCLGTWTFYSFHYFEHLILSSAWSDVCNSMIYRGSQGWI